MSELVQDILELYLHEVVGLADELHISVLDAVVDHLYEVSAAALTHPVTARVLPGLGTDGLQSGLNMTACLD